MESKRREADVLRGKLCAAFLFFCKSLAQFFCGALLYYQCERVFRALRHHPAPRREIYLLGGLAVLLLVCCCRLPFKGRKKWALVPLVAGISLTVFEYCFGAYYLFVRGVRLWDYRGCRFEFQGLICLRFSLCWMGAGLLTLFLDAGVEKLLSRTPFAYEKMKRLWTGQK